jgi:hypothetical protein
MNLYLLVEGRRTEKKVYPKWISCLIPELSEIKDPSNAVENNYYLFNGNGFPSILDNHLRNSVEEINELGTFNYLVMCIDADEVEVDERKKEVFDFIESNSIRLNSTTEFVLIIQNRCIETWCLGNRKVYKRQPNSEELKEYVEFYNVYSDDPELMGRLEPHETHAQFHASYLTEMLSERNIRYTKNFPRGVVEQTYLEEMVKRTSKSNHIQTFRSFLDFCTTVKNQIK